MIVTRIKTPLFSSGDSLLKFLYGNLPVLQNGDIVVITSKIVALSERRTAAIEDKAIFIHKEAQRTVETPWATLTYTIDGWGINAGIDESNAGDKLILMPKDSFRSAEKIRQALCNKLKIKNLGVLITDTRSTPLRVGTIGRAIGFSGFQPLKSYVGKKDLYGRQSRVTVSNIADALAASAVMVMGEGDEQTPLVVIQEAIVNFTSKSFTNKTTNLSLDVKEDIYSYVFNAEFEHGETPKKSQRNRK